MSETDVLARAVARGIITPVQAQALERLRLEDVSAAPAADVARDDEQLRFITGFADIFVTIGLVLFLGASGYFGIERLGQIGGYAVVAALAWGLSEFFVRRRRMALPGIVLLVVFALASFSSAAFAFVDGSAISRSVSPLGLLNGTPANALRVAAACLVTFALVLAHYRRFRVPITVAAGAASLAGISLALLAAIAPGFVAAYRDGLFILAGLGVFALAMRFDLSDPARRTRRTDIAFWLHLLAAPLIVHPILSSLTAGGDATRPAMFGVLAIVLGLAVVALAIDRRALLVSGLVYAGIAFGTLIRQAGFTDGILPASLLILGAFILTLSAGWHPLRKRMISALPRAVAARLPHPIGA